MIGTVVIDEVVLPIVGVRLSGGKLRITAEARGPMPLVRLADYVVQGDDGRTIYRSSRTEGITIGPLNERSSLTITLDVEIDNRTTQPAGPIRVTEK